MRLNTASVCTAGLAGVARVAGVPILVALRAMRSRRGCSTRCSRAVALRLRSTFESRSPDCPPVLADHKALGEHDLFGSDCVDAWADGIDLRIRWEEVKIAARVVMGVGMDGTEEPIAMIDGYGESSVSWANLLRDCARRGTHAPLLTAGGGALGFSNTLSQVLPATRHQRRWVRSTANALDCLPKSAQPAGKKAIHDICHVEDGDHAARAAEARWRAVSASQLAERSGAVAV